MSVSVSTTAGNQVTVTVDGATQLSFTTQESSISVVNGDTSSISVTNQGPKGDTGIQGPQGETGATGAGVAAGGTANEFLQKNSATDYDTKWSAYTLPAADGDDGQVLTTDGGGRVSFAFPKTIAEDVKNVSGGTLSKGTPVHVTGSVGNLAEVIAADAATNYPAHFVLDEDLADEGEGKGIALGFINNVDVPDASIYTEGQTVYLGASGGWTTTKPTGANAIQNLGILIKVNTSGNKVSGIIMGAGRANDVPNIPNGQIWIGNASGVATPTAFGVDLDSTPQLGGDLDVNGNKITSASNGDITIDPDGTGAIIFKSDDIQFDGDGGFGTGKIKLYESDVLGSNFIAIAAPLSVTSDTTLTLPDGDGSSGQVLSTNGAGSLSWANNVPSSNPDFTGYLDIRSAGATQGTLFLFDSDNSNYISLGTPATLSSDIAFVLPGADGTDGQVLKTDGSGNLSFVDQTADTDTNLGNSDQTLSADRTVELGGNSLVFENSSSEVAKLLSNGYLQATGRVIINGGGAVGGLVRFYDADSSNFVALRSPATVGSDLDLTLPDADGSSGQVLKTDGSGNLSFGDAMSRGGTYSWSGYATDVTKTATFYYQFPSATATSSSTDMISGFVGQAISHGTYGANGSMTLDGLSSTDSATYSMTVKVTTNGTIIIGTLSPSSGQFTAANQIVTSSASEQTFTLTQTSPTSCLSEGGKQWVLGLQVTFFGATSVDFRVEDLSITVS